MAKRKRLTPAQPDYLAGTPASGSGPLAAPAGSAPIAQVASAAATEAALQQVSEEWARARRDGRVIEEVDLAAIAPGHLVRDRIEEDETEMAALMDSLRSRGQQTPIEVVALDPPQGEQRYGLISGWRRLSALKRLYDGGTEPEFAKVKIRVIQPDSAQSAYLAMVEENEIRVNLSHYERARIVDRALQEGVFDTQKAALQGLFGNVARAKRSKIGSFLTLVRLLDDVLYHPTAISEKLGLALVKALTDRPDRAADLRARLLLAERPVAAAELSLLQGWLQDLAAAETEASPPAQPQSQAQSKAPAPASAPASDTARRSAPEAADAGAVTLAPGLQLRHRADKGTVELSGPALDAPLLADLQTWLRQRLGE